MKTYVITEQDIERLRERFEGEGLWYIARLDEWEETLDSLNIEEIYSYISNLTTTELFEKVDNLCCGNQKEK